MTTEQAISAAAWQLAENYQKTHLPMYDAPRLPSRQEVIALLRDLQKLLFPAFYGERELLTLPPEEYAALLLTRAARRLRTQLLLTLPEGEDAEAVCRAFLTRLPEVQLRIDSDLAATIDGDPAARSMQEVIFSYPGLFATFIYRVAHELYLLGVPMLPRIMTEYAHSQTGIDLHPGAQIGEAFFIDHGTGVVVGETAVIGDHARLYQGVTVGALAPAGAKPGGRRHPKLGSHVTLYANATLLGGETEVGDGAVIGGNAFVTESVAPNTTVHLKKPEMIVRGKKE